MIFGACSVLLLLALPAAALGGRDRIEVVRTLVVTGDGTGYSAGSDKTDANL